MAIFAQSFGDDFKDWFADGATSSVIYMLLVLAVVAVVLAAARR